MLGQVEVEVVELQVEVKMKATTQRKARGEDWLHRVGQQLYCANCHVRCAGHQICSTFQGIDLAEPPVCSIENSAPTSVESGWLWQMKSPSPTGASSKRS